MISEGAELIGESGATYLAVAPLGQANVWVGSVRDNPSDIVVIKEPDSIDPSPWTSFQNEMAMHELFKHTSSIRKQVDRIPPSRSGGPPMLVLEMFETTLWTARTKRPFTTAELKAVCKASLIGLRDVHDQGLVYSDLKMQNVMVNGFDVNNASDAAAVDNLVVKLGDLGEVMPPSMGKVQPVSYRAPEVFFKGEITSKADIWGWGLIYCHLLEARNRHNKTGLYDDLPTAHGTIPEQESVVKYAISNDYKIHDEEYFRNVALPQRNDATEKGDQWEELRTRGLPDGEVDFLRWVMRADPTKRPSAEQILRCGWLDKTEKEAAAGFEIPRNARGRTSIEHDPTRSDGQQGRKVVADALKSGNDTPFDGGPTMAAPKVMDGPVSRAPTGGLAPGAYGHGNTMPGSTSSSSAGPTPFNTQNTVNQQIDDIYSQRLDNKRRPSNTLDADIAAKKAYTSTAMTETPVQTSIQTGGFSSEALSGANAATASSTNQTETQTRPGNPSRNTGTFLSYR